MGMKPRDEPIMGPEDTAYNKMIKPQADPVKNEHPGVWSLVLVDMAQRDIEGAKKYGTRLQPHNGRDVLIDAYQEALDLAVYLRQAIYERDGK